MSDHPAGSALLRRCRPSKRCYACKVLRLDPDRARDRFETIMRQDRSFALRLRALERRLGR